MIGNFDEKQNLEDNVRIWNAEDAVETILCYKVPIGCYCKLFKRELLDYTIRFILEVFIGEVFNFNIDVFQNSKKVVVGSRKTYYYRRRDNPTSAMTKFSIKNVNEDCGHCEHQPQDKIKSEH